MLEAEAFSVSTMGEANMEIFELGEFASAWDAVPVEVEMRDDTPSVELREKRAKKRRRKLRPKRTF